MNNKNYVIVGISAVVLALLVILGTSGCKTVVTPNTDGTYTTNKVVNSAAVVQVINSVVPVAVQIAVNKDANCVAYFQASTLVIDTLVNSGTYDPAKLQAALVSLKATSQDAQLAIQAALSIYKSFAADAVTAKLKQSEYLVVLSALSDGIKQGLMFSANPNGVGQNIQIKVVK